jgi:outer membrane receptor protein involved in Fe transport
MFRKLWICVWMLLFASLGLAAENEDTRAGSKKAVELDEILVTATQLKDDPETPNKTVIIPEALLQGPGSTLDSALRRQPGIDVQRAQEVGGALDDDSIKIRGFGGSRIVVTVDGRILNAPGTAGGYFIDWTTMPLNNVQEIEIIKGVSDPRYGNTLGGVVNLVTKKPQKIGEVEAQVSGGSFNSKKFDFFHAYKPGAFEYSIAGGYASSDGYLYNGSFWTKNAALHLGYDLPWKGKFIVDVQYVEVQKGFIAPNRLNNVYGTPYYDTPKYRQYPASDGEIMYGGMGATPQRGSWWNKDRITYSLGYEQTFLNSFLHMRYWENYGNREAYNTNQTGARTFHKEFYDDRSYGFDTTYKHRVANHSITAGLDAKTLKDNGDKNYWDDFRAAFRNYNYVSANSVGIFLMDDIYFFDKKLIATPGVRYSSFYGKSGPAGKAEGIPNISMDGFAPSLKFTYNYVKDALAYVSIARALRLPTLPEYYWHFSPDAGVNTSSLPFKKEDGVMLQGGWKAKLSNNTKVEISPYYYYIKDYIHFDLINFVSYNIDEARIYGIELGVTHQLNREFSLFSNYTYQKSKTTGDPFVSKFLNPVDRGFNQIPGLPENKINAGIQYKRAQKERITLYASYVSNQRVIYNNNTLYNTDLRVRTQDPYFTMDIEGVYPLTRYLDVNAYVHNLLNSKYQERFGYEAAGVNFGIGLRAYY